MNDELPGKLREWLERQGYPLELRVARVFREHGVGCAHGRHYEDPDEGTSREIDLVAYFDSRTRRGLNVHLAVECKSTSKPWVIFTTDQHTLTRRGHVCSFPSSEPAEAWLEEAAELEEVQELPLFKRPDRIGFNMTQAFSEGGSDAAYAAMMSASKAAVALAHFVNTKVVPGTAVTYVPVVVVSSPLFEATLDERGELSLEPIEQGVILRRDVAAAIPLHVVRELSLRQFCADARRSAEALQEIVSLPGDASSESVRGTD